MEERHGKRLYPPLQVATFTDPMKVPVASCIGHGLVLAALLTCSHAMSAETQTGTAAPGQEAKVFDQEIKRHVSFRYLWYTPKEAKAPGDNRWPLLVFLHGAGERGNDLQKVAVHGPPKLIQNGKDFPCFVMSPQCPEGTTWDIEGLDALLSGVLASAPIDPRRVYLTGLSMGGYGSWAWAAAHPERFAAIVPICGGGDPISVWLAAGPRREHLATLPIWVFHGARDPVVPLAESERMIDAYKRVSNNTAKLTVYPDAGHDSWTEAYNSQELWQWLFQQRRP